MDREVHQDKPQVVHLLDDLTLGGVSLAVEDLCRSSLTQEYGFEIATIDFTRPIHCLLNKVSADIICIHTSASWRKLVGLLFFRLRNPSVPFLFQEHHYCEGFVRHQVRYKKRFYLLLHLTYRLMNRVLAVSAAQGQWILTNKLVSREKLTVTGQARELAHFKSRATPTASKSTTQIVIGAYGRFHYQKGFDILVRAMELLTEYDLVLKLGGEGEQSALLQELAKDLDNVDLIGVVNDVPQFLMLCDVIVIPSRWEPYGLTCLEAKAANKSIICAQVDGLVDQISNKTVKDGVWRINKPTAAGIANAILQYVRDKKQSQALNDTVHFQGEADATWQELLTVWGKVLGDCY